ncbi:MAG TPA: GGDEF domain-containing protein [Anaerolineales bacterium]|nr:GGDEF domain-containing protein [Anaerolineales bacterium]
MMQKHVQRIFSQILIDLGELEGDYRVFHLKNDIAQIILSISIVSISMLGMLGTDALLFTGRPDLLMKMALYRAGFILISIAVMFATSKTIRVRIFDRLVFGWISLAVLSILLFNFTRPANYLTTAFDIIVPFAIYALSPLKLFQNIMLAFAYSAGTLYINHVFKIGVDPLALSDATAAQFVVHALGLGSVLQIQSYRRKSFKAYMDEKDAKEMVAYMVNIDPLTKSLTRRHFFNMAQSEFQRFARYRRPLSALVLDLDLFKNVNDTYGHHAGDIVLRSFSLVAIEQKRVQDTFGRLGGEEFGLLLPETNLEQARIVAERIQKTWEKSPVNMDGVPIRSTVSIGVAEAGEEDKSFEGLMRRADLMMYKAKERGKNQVAAE